MSQFPGGTFASGVAATTHEAEKNSASANPAEPSRIATNDHADPEKGEQLLNGSGSTSNADNEEKAPLGHTDTMHTSFEAIGTATLYKDGELVLIPAPSKDPRDPLNLPLWHKFLGIFCLSFFGALAAAAELILGAMLPVFAIQYAGYEPGPLLGLIDSYGGLPADTNPLESLQLLPNSVPLWHVYLLASLPVLMIGVSNLFLIPLSITFGRRPVVLSTGLIAIAGCIWAGQSTSLGTHLGARAIQAIGAGTVESLIPFIIQDMVHVHQRNTWISGAFAAQGIIIIALGIATPYMIIELSWRYVYHVTAAGAGAFLIGVYFFMPETRWQRTKAEQMGVPRPEEKEYLPRTWKYNLAIMHGEIHYKKGAYALLDTLLTFFYPHIFFITMLNSAMIGCTFAAGYTMAPALLTQPWSWKFNNVGLLLIPVLVSAVAVALITGVFADFTANMAAKVRGRRVPENQLLNLIFPTICGLLGAILFGAAGSDPDRYPWIVFLIGLGLMAFGFLGANTIGAVYVLECYPHLAGPALVNIGAIRALIAFVLSFRVADLIVDFGYLNSMAIYTGIIGLFGLLIPVVYIWGPAWRKRWPAANYGENRKFT